MQNHSNKRKVFNLNKLGFDRCLDFGYYQYNKVEPVLKSHIHKDALEICFCLKGQQYYEIGGELHKLKGNSIIIIPPNVNHSSGRHPEDIGILFWLQISLQKSKGYLCNLPNDQSDFLLEELIKYKNKVFKGAYQLKPILEKIIRLLENPQCKFNELYIRQSIVQLILETVVLAKKPQQASNLDKQNLLNDFIDRNMYRTIYVDELALLVGFSTAYFKSWFKQHFGVSPKAYVNRLKIQQAEKDLPIKKTITQVAFDLGFSSSQYFSNVFKKHTGMSPGAYILSQKTGVL